MRKLQQRLLVRQKTRKMARPQQWKVTLQLRCLYPMIHLGNASLFRPQLCLCGLPSEVYGDRANARIRALVGSNGSLPWTHTLGICFSG